MPQTAFENSEHSACGNGEFKDLGAARSLNAVLGLPAGPACVGSNMHPYWPKDQKGTVHADLVHLKYVAFSRVCCIFGIFFFKNWRETVKVKMHLLPNPKLFFKVANFR